MSKTKITLIFILLLAFLLRFYRLGTYPALNADEAAIGYNAYSLIQTGRDEHGNPWPLHFQSFNDYKPGFYFYLVLPFIAAFGLNAWSVRIPNAFLGVATVYFVYLVTAKLYEMSFEKEKKLRKLIDYPAIFASFLLAVSPWHIHFSRGAWEVNTSSFLMVLGLWFFIKALKGKRTFLILSSLAFVLSLYTYHATRVVVPLLILGLIVIYKENLKRNLKNYLLAFFVGLLLLLPLIKDFAKGEAFSRAAGVGLFADPGPLARINEQRGEHGDFTGKVAKLFHNKPVNYGLAFLNNYFKHFDGNFLFISGDSIQRNKVPETGQMYFFDFIWISLGMIFLFKNFKEKESKLILLWLLVSPVASSLTFQSPNALRSENMVIPLVVIGALGLFRAIMWGKRIIVYRHLLTSYYLLIFSLITWQFVRYQHMYWLHMAKEYPFSSQYGVKELVDFVRTEGENFKKIVVTDRYDQPYILFLFYLNYPPEKFQKEHVLTSRDKFGFSTVRDFDKYEFKSISWDTDRVKYPGALIVGTSQEIPKEANIVKKIYGQNAYEYFVVVAN